MTKETYFIPVKIESEANKMEHWTKKMKRKKILKMLIKFYVKNVSIKPPCKVTLTRIAPRLLDVEDNLPASLKASKDIVADILIPGLAPGRADGSKDITWDLRQEKGGVRDYSLKIEMEEI